LSTGNGATGNCRLATVDWQFDSKSKGCVVDHIEKDGQVAAARADTGEIVEVRNSAARRVR
jgi:hypothetical protein